MHNSVIADAEHMLLTLKRYYYVTPTSYLELVQGYLRLKKIKQTEIGNQRDKLRGGLEKLETAEK